MKNCAITIEQREGNKITSTVFRTDDYRIATALINILFNVECVVIEITERRATN